MKVRHQAGGEQGSVTIFFMAAVEVIGMAGLITLTMWDVVKGYTVHVSMLRRYLLEGGASFSDASEVDLGREGDEEVMHVYFGSVMLWNDDTLFYVCS